MHIRRETVDDCFAVAHVNRTAFGGDDEARLVDLLRRDGDVVASLVAVAASGEIVGHIMFSRAAIVTASRAFTVASLAPMAVAPSWQRQGIGSRLVKRGLEACRDCGEKAVIVVGHPSYYPRFGFRHECVAHLANPFANDEAFMGLEIVPGALGQVESGRITYPNAFRELAE